MQAYDKFTAIVSGEREPRANIKTLLSCVLPRPIAFVSTLSESGVANLAPYSFFNGVGSNPPAVIFSPATRPDGSSKDTINNLRARPECVVNVVAHSFRSEMNDTSFPYPPDKSEFEAVGFTPLPSQFVKPPRAAEAPIQMECKLLQIVPVGGKPLSGNICICEVLCFHVADEVLLPDGTADVSKLDLVGRLGGDDYCTTRDRFAMPKPTPPR